MRLLTFLARRFEWSTAETADGGERAEAAVVVFVEAEAHDEADPDRALRHLVKHVKWQAREREIRSVVLHSFAHLGTDAGASAGFAERWLEDAGARLERSGFRVHSTPFGASCAWSLDVYGEPMAKVWKRT